MDSHARTLPARSLLSSVLGLNCHRNCNLLTKITHNDASIMIDLCPNSFTHMFLMIILLNIGKIKMDAWVTRIRSWQSCTSQCLLALLFLQLILLESLPDRLLKPAISRVPCIMPARHRWIRRYLILWIAAVVWRHAGCVCGCLFGQEDGCCRSLSRMIAQRNQFHIRRGLTAAIQQGWWFRRISQKAGSKQSLAHPRQLLGWWSSFPRWDESSRRRALSSRRLWGTRLPGRLLFRWSRWRWQTMLLCEAFEG